MSAVYDSTKQWFENVIIIWLVYLDEYIFDTVVSIILTFYMEYSQFY